MNANDVVSKLIAAEMDADMPTDGKRVIRTERMRLQSALKHTPNPNEYLGEAADAKYAFDLEHDRAASVAIAKEECIRVARMWGVDLALTDALEIEQLQAERDQAIAQFEATAAAQGWLRTDDQDGK